MVVNDKKELLGIVTDRDMVFASENQIVIIMKLLLWLLTFSRSQR